MTLILFVHQDASHINTAYDDLCAVLYKMTNKKTPIKEGKNGK